MVAAAPLTVTAEAATEIESGSGGVVAESAGRTVVVVQLRGGVITELFYV